MQRLKFSNESAVNRHRNSVIYCSCTADHSHHITQDDDKPVWDYSKESTAQNRHFGVLLLLPPLDHNLNSVRCQLERVRSVFVDIFLRLHRDDSQEHFFDSNRKGNHAQRLLVQ